MWCNIFLKVSNDANILITRLVKEKYKKNRFFSKQGSCDISYREIYFALQKVNYNLLYFVALIASCFLSKKSFLFIIENKSISIEFLLKRYIHVL